MAQTRQRVADILFVAQIVGLVLIGVSQFVKMLDSVRGVSASMHLCFLSFLTFMTMLAWRTYRHHPTRLTKQILAIYLVGFVVIGACTGLLVRHLIVGLYIWRMNDTLTIILACTGSSLTLTIGYLHGLSVNDPIVRGVLASCSKALPQFLMAWKMWHEGGEGYAAVAIWTAHITTMIRITQILLTRVSSQQGIRNRAGLMIGESTNEISWCCVTVAWYVGG